MARREKPEPPYLVITGAESSPLVRAALAGAEEEGVPTHVLAPASSDPLDSAHRAALDSPLEVGLAVTDGGLALTHAKLAPGEAIEVVGTPTPAQARRLGHNAARVVVGMPLRMEAP